jgi:hypothetical protein
MHAQEEKVCKSKSQNLEKVGGGQDGKKVSASFSLLSPRQQQIRRCSILPLADLLQSACGAWGSLNRACRGTGGLDRITALHGGEARVESAAMHLDRFLGKGQWRARTIVFRGRIVVG